MERETARAKRTKHPFVLAFVDVDRLKATNDSLGHAAGDHLLRRTVESMRKHLRSYDLIVRFGGDEFVCALVDLSARYQLRHHPVGPRLSAVHIRPTGSAPALSRNCIAIIQSKRK